MPPDPMDRERNWRTESAHGPGPALADRNLVPLSPRIYNDFNCPGCGAPSPNAVRSLFIGIQVLGEYECPRCHAHFHRDLPIGFQMDLPLAFTVSERRVFDRFAEQ